VPGYCSRLGFAARLRAAAVHCATPQCRDISVIAVDVKPPAQLREAHTRRSCFAAYYARMCAAALRLACALRHYGAATVRYAGEQPVYTAHSQRYSSVAAAQSFSPMRRCRHHRDHGIIIDQQIIDHTLLIIINAFSFHFIASFQIIIATFSHFISMTLIIFDYFIIFFDAFIFAQPLFFHFR